jgi:hypothetical protein
MAYSTVGSWGWPKIVFLNTKSGLPLGFFAKNWSLFWNCLHYGGILGALKSAKSEGTQSPCRVLGFGTKDNGIREVLVCPPCCRPWHQRQWYKRGAQSSCGVMGFGTKDNSIRGVPVCPPCFRPWHQRQWYKRGAQSACGVIGLGTIDHKVESPSC